MILHNFIRQLTSKECIFKKLHESLLLQRFCSSESLVAEPENLAQRKLLKVAILGRPNAGKSTLINKITNLNVCDVSSKSHTTLVPLKAAYVSGSTQIIFIDTPGLVTKKECRKFELDKEFLESKENLFNEVDIVGAVYDMSRFSESLRFHSNLVKTLKEIPETKPVFLIINKVDLIRNKNRILEAVDFLINKKDSKDSSTWKKFSKVFLISALKNDGITDVINFLLEKAKPGEWLFEPGKICDTPLHILIPQLLRGKILDALPEEVPYKCSFVVEYLEENELGELICVAVITTERPRHLKMLVRNRTKSLQNLCRQLESDLYTILKRVVRLRVVVVSKKEKTT